MKSFLSSLDFLTPSVSLYYKRRKRYFSLVGLIMSTIFLFSVSYLGIKFLIDYIRGKEKFLINYNSFEEQQISGNFSEKLFFFSLQDFNGQKVDPRILQVVPIYWETHESGDKFEYLKQRPCSEEFFPKEKTHLIDFDLSQYTCVSRENKKEFFKLYSDKSTYLSSFITLYVARCQSTFSQNCLSEKEIEDGLKNSKYNLVTFNEVVEIDHSKRKPFGSNIFMEKIFLTSGYASEYKYKVRKVAYESSKSFFSPSVEKFEDFGLDTTTRTIFNSKDKNFFVPGTELMYEMGMSVQVENYQRTYQSFQTYLGRLGGIAYALHFALEFITFCFSYGEVMLNLYSSKFKKNNNLILAQIKENTINNKMTNNFLVNSRSNLSGSSIKISDINERNEKKRLKDVSILEVMCFKVCKKKMNCRFINECEKFLLSSLDIRFILSLSKELEHVKIEKKRYSRVLDSNIGVVNTSNKTRNSKFSSDLSSDKFKSLNVKSIII